MYPIFQMQMEHYIALPCVYMTPMNYRLVYIITLSHLALVLTQDLCKYTNLSTIFDYKK